MRTGASRPGQRDLAPASGSRSRLDGLRRLRPYPDAHRMVSIRDSVWVPGEVTRVVVITAATAVLILLLAPPAGDAAAHLYRTYLVERDVLVWDTFWYRGNYPIFSYSLFYYPLAALVGNTPLTVIGMLAAAAAFTAVTIGQWGRFAVWPARAFGVFAAGPLITGTFAYGLGLASGLAALWAAQRRRPWLVFVLAGVTLGLSPLAFAFLLLVLLAVPIARGHLDRVDLWLGGGLAVLLGTSSAVIAALGDAGSYPFDGWSLLAVTTVGGCGLALAWRTPDARLLAAFFALWLAASVTLFFLSSPLGETITRLRYVVFPLMLATVLLAGWRPRWLAITGLFLASLYNVVPYAVSVTVRSLDTRPARAEYWRPAIDFLHANNSPDHLVEVVATESHWEAYWLPRAGIPLVRGWYRQTDVARNDVLYDSQASPGQYRRWLDSNAVRYVVLPSTRLDAYTGAREAALVRSPQTGLVPVMRTPDMTLYEVPRATTLLTGPGDARVTSLGHQQVAGWVAEPGMYELRLEWSRYWRDVSSHVCVSARAGAGTIELWARRSGPFRLAIVDRPRDIVGTLVVPAGHGGTIC